MRKLVLYTALGGSFLLALVLESMFTRGPRGVGENTVVARLGGTAPRIVIPEQPPEDDPLEFPEWTEDDDGDAAEPVPSGRGADPDPADPESTPAPVRYRVRERESLWTLAERFLGDGALWPELAEANGIEPEDLRAGMEIVVPHATQHATTGPTVTEETPYREYVVRAGDTLSAIAENQLGSSARWREIRDLNRLAGERVIAGDVLLLPREGVRQERP